MSHPDEELDVAINAASAALTTQPQGKTRGFADPEVSLVERDIDVFKDTCDVLVAALDEAGKVHPFVLGESLVLSCLISSLTRRYATAAVVAFKAALSLEVARRDNDRKILALYVRMKDMMSTLSVCVSSF